MAEEPERIKEEVRRRYAARATQARQRGPCCGSEEKGPISSNLYSTDDIQELPQEAVVASLGCGNPVAIADLRQGETVLDLGSGGGIDVLLSARRVGPTGKAYGLDMTDEMLDLARENARKAGVSNVEFLKGEMENIPLPDASVDVIISNCVINLSPDKDAVLREAFRVLKPGGRLAVADVVTRGRIPPQVRRDLELWAGCIAGALSVQEYTEKLRAAGFHEIQIDVFREYSAADAKAAGLGDLLRQAGREDADPIGIASAVIRASRPGGRESRAPYAAPSAAGEPLPVVSSPGHGCTPGTCC